GASSPSTASTLRRGRPLAATRSAMAAGSARRARTRATERKSRLQVRRSPSMASAGSDIMRQATGGPAGRSAGGVGVERCLEEFDAPDGPVADGGVDGDHGGVVGGDLGVEAVDAP